MHNASGSSSLRRSARSNNSHPYKKETNPLRPSLVSRIKLRHRPKAEPESPTLCLRVNRKFVSLIPAVTQDEPNPQPVPPPLGTTGNLRVITADVTALRRFAGNTVDWLIKIARLIFEPLGAGCLYTFTTQSVEWWENREMELSNWRKVDEGEQLRGMIYEFRPGNEQPIVLTRMSLRRSRSITNISSDEDGPTTFRNQLLKRDSACVISQQHNEESLVASHLIPKRLGDAGVQSALQRFTGYTTSVGRFDPTVGVLLFVGTDVYVDSYDLGFWNVGPDRYVMHCFRDIQMNLGGMETSDRPQIHGHHIVLSSEDPSVSLPPAGVFNWHYVQCVLKKFSTPSYRAIPNIVHFTFPFHTKGDIDESDRDFDDPRNIANPPYPSYFWDLALFRASQRLEVEERNRSIAAWSSGVSAD